MRLEARSLTLMRDSAKLLQDAHLAAAGGELIGVIGPNGAGKSSLLRALAGLEKTAEGDILYDGVDIRAKAPAARARLLAYLPQAREAHWSVTARVVASLGRFAYGAPHRLGPDDRTAVDRALAATDAAALEGRLMHTLSGGEQARIHLARALAAETPVLLADEPTAALDLRHAIAVIETLREKARAGALVIAALHDLALARRYCTRLVALDGGRIVADGEPREALSGELIERVFGVDRALVL